MPRRTFDLITSWVGVMLTAALIVAGALFFWGYSFANSSVSTQLTAQRIYFPPKGSEGISSLPAKDQPFIAKYAGQQLTNGEQAQAFADHYIAVHLNGIADGKTYAEVSSLSRANPDNQELAGQVQTLFRGETLRGLLLNGYAFWKMGQLAFIGSMVAFGLAIAMFVLTILGFLHLRKVSPVDKVFAPPVEIPQKVSA